MKKLLHITLLILLAVFLFCAPAAIAHGVHMNIYTLRSDIKTAKYQGTIEIWHVVSFKTHGSSGVGYLKTRAASFEKSNSYVYISVKGMTPQEALERAANCELPDIISSPQLFELPGASLRSLTLPTKKLPEKFASDSFRLPYMYDEYVLCCNEAIFNQLGVSLPLGEEMDEDTLLKVMHEASANDLTPLTLTSVQFLTPLSALSAAQFPKEEYSLYAEEQLPSLSEYSIPVDSGEFAAQTAAMFICTRCELNNLLESKQGASLSVREYALSDFTDAVQCVSVLSKGDSKKEDMCESFALSLLSNRAQSGLDELGMMRVIPEK